MNYFVRFHKSMNNMKKTIFFTVLGVISFSAMVWYLLVNVMINKTDLDHIFDTTTSLIIQTELDHLDNYDMLYELTQDSITVVKIDSLRGEFLVRAKEFEKDMNESKKLELNDSKKLLKIYIDRLEKDGF